MKTRGDRWCVPSISCWTSGLLGGVRVVLRDASVATALEKSWLFLTEEWLLKAVKTILEVKPRSTRPQAWPKERRIVGLTDSVWLHRDMFSWEGLHLRTSQKMHAKVISRKVKTFCCNDSLPAYLARGSSLSELLMDVSCWTLMNMTWRAEYPEQLHGADPATGPIPPSKKQALTVDPINLEGAPSPSKEERTVTKKKGGKRLECMILVKSGGDTMIQELHVLESGARVSFLLTRKGIQSYLYG